MTLRPPRPHKKNQHSKGLDSVSHPSDKSSQNLSTSRWMDVSVIFFSFRQKAHLSKITIISISNNNRSRPILKLLVSVWGFAV